MKRFTLVLMALLSVSCMVKAQQYVSTEPAQRNVIIEEFTGRNCGYCPDGHRIANTIMANHPGRVWAINVHAGSYAPSTYPNFKTTDGNAIHSGFTISGYPTGVVNRSTAAGQSRSAWNNLSNTQLNLSAVCNVAGAVVINPDTRNALITIEVYYTDNSAYTQNYLTIAMLQDSILGSQAGMSGNPGQVMNGTYCHMHVLRDIVTPAWGDAITPTTEGTLITKTYVYPIPERIGNPNGVDVILDHIFFLAWVSERYQGTPTRPILNACELQKSYGFEPIYPMVSNVHQTQVVECSQTKGFTFEMTNYGTETLTSVKYNVEIAGQTQEFEWTGELAAEDTADVSFEMEIPFGTYSGTLLLTEANGVPFEAMNNLQATCSEWPELEVVDSDVTDLKLYIVQDQFGEQITWDIINSTGEVVAEGGPYEHLANSGDTQVNVEDLPALSTDECYLFRIYDSNNNGICCNYGNGYYYFEDSDGNTFLEGAGNYGAMATEIFSIKKSGYGFEENEVAGVIIYPNPANNKVCVVGENIETVEIYNILGQKVTTVEGSDDTTVDVASYQDGIYLVRVVTGESTITTKKITIIH